MAIPLRTGNEARKVNARLAMRAGEAAYLAGHPLISCPFNTPMERCAWREGWGNLQVAALAEHYAAAGWPTPLAAHDGP